MHIVRRSAGIVASVCGIVGYVGERAVREVLLAGLGKLEYRGYDSAGIAVLGPDGVVRVERSEGKLGNLFQKINGSAPPGSFGLGRDGELGWTPRASAEDALLELLEGLRCRDGMETPPLRRTAGGLLRSRELRSGVGGTKAPA